MDKQDFFSGNRHNWDRDETEAAIQQSIGKVIAELTLTDGHALNFTFDDATGLEVQDRYQCCENRYMRTDDNLAEYIGGTLIGFERRVAPDAKHGHEDKSCSVHEVCFLAVKTSKGEFVITNHNEHNGNYDGFTLVASVTDPTDPNRQ